MYFLLGSSLFLLWTLTFVTSCLLFPLGAFFYEAFASRPFGGSLFFAPIVLSTVRDSLSQALMSAIFASLIGIPAGLWLGILSRSKLKRLIECLLFIPFGVPSLVAALGFILCFGKSGFLARYGLKDLGILYNIKGVVLAHVFYNVPFMTLVVSHHRERVSQAQMSAARLLGTGPFTEIYLFVWPQLKNAVQAAFIQIVIFCLMSFALVLLLGGGPPVQTLETEIVGHMERGLAMNYPLGLVFVFYQLLILLLLTFCLRAHPVRRGEEGSEALFLKRLEEKKRWLSFESLSYFAFVLFSLFWLSPYFLTLSCPFFNLFFNPAKRVEVLCSLAMSLILSIASSLTTVINVLCVIFALNQMKQSARRRNLIEVCLLSVSSLSPIVLSVCFQISYGKFINPFGNHFFLFILLQMTTFFPFAFRILAPAFAALRSKQIEAAVIMGENPYLAFWQIEKKRLSAPLLIALLGVFGASLGEYSALYFFSNSEYTTLPLLISQWLNRYRFEEAQALSGFLFLISALVLGSSYYLGTSRGEKRGGLNGHIR